jgi:hypothetical protein
VVLVVRAADAATNESKKFPLHRTATISTAYGPGKKN